VFISSHFVICQFSVQDYHYFFIFLFSFFWFFLLFIKIASLLPFIH
jgi:hypothetical protein